MNNFIETTTNNAYLSQNNINTAMVKHCRGWHINYITLLADKVLYVYIKDSQNKIIVLNIDSTSARPIGFLVKWPESLWAYKYLLYENVDTKVGSGPRRSWLDQTSYVLYICPYK